MSSIILTSEDIAKWKARVSDLQAQVRKLERKIAAAEILLDDGGDVEVSHAAPKSVSSTSNITLVDAIVKVLQDVGGGPLNNDEIKDLLPEVGFDVESMHKNYYYTATKRLSDKGLIKKNEDGTYSLPQKNEPPEGGSETGEGSTSLRLSEQERDGDLLSGYS